MSTDPRGKRNIVDLVLRSNKLEWVSVLDQFEVPVELVRFLEKPWLAAADQWDAARKLGNDLPPPVGMPVGEARAWSRDLEKLLNLDGSVFVGPWELDLFMERFGDQICELDPRDPRRHIAMAVALKDPLRPHPFELDFISPIGGTHDFAVLDLQVGGPKKLTVKWDDGKKRTTMSGVVQAATLEGAMRRVEQTFDEFAGALRAVGMCTLGNAWIAPASPEPCARVLDEWRSSGEPEYLGPVYGRRVPGVRFTIPPDATDLDRYHIKAGNFTKALNRQTILVKKVLTGQSARAEVLRNACRLAIDAEDALEFGILISLAFSCVEGLLVPEGNRGDTLARLAEGVAFSLGRSAEERDALRRRVRKLYDIRSAFVHTGRVYERAADREEALEIMYRVLQREISFLPDPAAE